MGPVQVALLQGSMVNRQALALFGALLCVSLAGCTAAPPAAQEDVLESLFSSDDQVLEKVRCLTDAGWKSTLEDEGIVTQIPEGQESAFERADVECSDKAGMNFSGDLTEEQYGAVYDWYGGISDCLAEHNWAVPVKPSFETFKSTYDADPWIPWSQVTGDQSPRAMEDCPVMNIPNS